eukprot:CAMPEP_0202809976 /NCGR_PEP_ID=MMETSP1389-20130828/2184_1 /ASSEMBLY_ACC=CAM_ASM_000865 /TAXON_ID=302021 /ORGANISM="Rhodomonas sp., Strain CCMP768" /LENGTH=245 /DNA_ID=CAMNT_0049480739 /DNA_START=13 /DNA_END=750 /DNA_ORIENTATION=+
MACSGVKVFALLCVLSVALSIPTIHIEVNIDGDDVPPAPTPGTCKAVNETECTDDSCCNWCMPPNSTLGFCMTMIPYPVPAFECKKDVSSCKLHTTSKNCAKDGQCSWIPMGPPTAELGLCVYDWDRCKAPSFVPSGDEPKPAPSKPPAPKPTMGCTAKTADECDGNSCCMWCGTMFNTTAPGFCMPILDIPIPTMECSKDTVQCPDMMTEAECESDDVCSWTPFGPPGAKGPGVCVFDWDKCKK